MNNKLKAGRPSKNRQELRVADLMQDTKLKRVNFDITEDEHQGLKMYAIKHKTTIKDLLTKHVRQLIKSADLS